MVKWFGHRKTPVLLGSTGPALKSNAMSPPGVLEPIQEEGPAAFSPEKLAGIRQLNVDPANSRFMLLVADLLRPESLPRGWSASFDAVANKWVYTDKAGALHDRHPVYDYYIGAMFMDHGGYAQLKANAKAHPPTADEVQQMGRYFNLKPEDDKYLWEVAEMGLCAPLPPGWKEEVVVDTGGGAPIVSFKHEESGKVQPEHPLDNYFRELIRRRRRELLRRKKAALRSLQALIKMGMGRRSLLAAVVAAGGDAGGSNGGGGSISPSAEEDVDVESFSADTQAALQAAWQGLLGTAHELVNGLAAAHWDRSAGLSPGACNPIPTEHTSNSRNGCCSGTTAGAAEPDQPNSSSTGSVARQLQQLSEVLRDALGPSSTPVHGSSAALSGIQGLAALVAAAGDDPDALARVLEQQDLALPHSCDLPDDLDDGFDGDCGDDGSGVTRAAAGLDGGAGCSSADSVGTATGVDGKSIVRGDVSNECSTGKDALLDAGEIAGDGSASSSNDASGSTAGSRRPSRSSFDGAAAAAAVGNDTPRRSSLLGAAVKFVGADGTTASTAGAVSSSGTGEEPWSLAGAQPDVAGAAAGAGARGAASARAAAGGQQVAALQPPDTAAGAAGGGEEAAVAGHLGDTGAGAPGDAGKAPQAAGAGAGAAGAGAAAASAAAASGAGAGGAGVGARASVKERHAVRFAEAFDAATAAAAASTHKAAQSGAPGAAEAAPSGYSGNCPPAVDSLSIVHAVGFPPAADAALKHLAALQAVLQEGLGLIKVWQQQKVIIAVLQHRLQQSLTAASSSRQRLLRARQELQQTRVQQMRHQAAAEAAAQHCRQLSEQLQQAEQDLRAAAAAKQDLQQQLDDAKAQLADKEDTITRLQAQSGSNAAATAAEVAALQDAHQALQQSYQQLQDDLTAAQAAAATHQEHCEQLQQQLAALAAQLAAEQGAKEDLQQQLQTSKDEFAALQARHDALLHSSGSDAAAAAAEMQSLQESLQQLQGSHAALQQDHETSLAALTAAQEAQQQLSGQLSTTQQQLADLQATHAALQANCTSQSQKLAETEAALVALQHSNTQQSSDLTSTQQQLLSLQDTHAQALQQQQQLRQEQQQLQLQHTALQSTLASTTDELKAMQAAARAAEEQRAARPHKGCQVSAADHAEQRWVAGKGVQTGQELNPKATKDVGTPADLSLLAYFFREIKQKQRGGGGAILGYDPAEAAKAAAASPPCQSAKSWSGGSALPPISPGAQEGRGGAGGGGGGGPKAPLPLRRPATMPGSINSGRRLEEEQEDDGGFNTRPLQWEVRQRVDRRRDRAIKLEADKQAAAAGDKWDYAQDERDSEIAELKRLLVAAEHRAKEAAGKASEELRGVTAELQACKRSLEQLQAENFTLNKDLVTLKLTMQAVELADGTSPLGDAPYGPDGTPHKPRMNPAALGFRPSGPRASTMPGAVNEAGFSGAAHRASAVVLNPSSSGPGQFPGSQLSPYSSSGSRASTAAYGAGRLSALPTGLLSPVPGSAPRAFSP